MEFPITGVGTLLTGLAWILFYLRLRKNTTSNNDFIKYFKGFSLFFGVFHLAFSIPLLLVPSMLTFLGVMLLIGHAFAMLSFAYLTRVALLLAKPSFNSLYVFIAYLIAGSGVIVFNMFNFGVPSISGGVVAWNQAPAMAALLASMTFIAYLPVVILFFKEAIAQPMNRRRFGFIGLSLLVTLITGPMHNATTNIAVLLTIDLVAIVAVAILFAGVASVPKIIKVQARVTA